MAHLQKRTDESVRTGRVTTYWQARYTAPDGAERTKRFHLKRDAENWITTNSADIVRGAWVDPKAGKITFRSYSKTWLSTKADVSARTRINIEGRLDNYALPHFGNMQMNAVRPSDVRTFVSKVVAAGKAPSTVKAIYLTTSQIFTQAVLDGLIAKSPCVGIKMPPEGSRDEMHFLTAKQLNELADAIDDRYRTLIYLAGYGGLRAGELAALKVAKVNVLKKTITVDCGASEVRGKFVIGTTKTGKSRIVGIPQFLATMIGEHIGRYPSEDGYVFTAKEGGPIRHRNLYRRHFRPAVERARMRAIKEDRKEDVMPEDLRFHDLRHTCAALLIANGRHMEEIKEHLGHSSIRVTSDRYGHLFPSARTALADSLEATFKTTVENPATDGGRTKSHSRTATRAINSL
jgi:integrase